MSERFRLWLAQLNPTVGDLTANADAARAAWAKARAAGADMIAFPEMFLTGYQLQDLVKKPAFAMDVHRVMGELAAACADGPAIGIGGPLPGAGKPFNAYYILQDGEISATVLKHHLPNYNVFDEKRYYHAGDPAGPVRVGPCAHRCPDLRRCVVRRRDRNACGNRGRDPAGAQRLPLSPGQDGYPSGPDGRPRHRNGPAAVPTSTSSAGRTIRSSTARASS
jgi:hypothetical protein